MVNREFYAQSADYGEEMDRVISQSASVVLNKAMELCPSDDLKLLFNDLRVLLESTDSLRKHQQCITEEDPGYRAQFTEAIHRISITGRCMLLNGTYKAHGRIFAMMHDAMAVMTSCAEQVKEVRNAEDYFLFILR